MHGPGSARFAFGLLAFTSIGAGGAAVLGRSVVDPGPDPARAIAAELAERGIMAAAQGVRPVDPPPAGPFAGLWLGRWVALGHRRGGQDDLYLVVARATPTGRVLSVVDVTNVTRSHGAAEAGLAVRAGVAAFSVATADGTEAVTLLDLQGEPAADTRGWSVPWKIANAISNFQRFGQPQGVRIRRYDLRATLPDRVVVRVEENAFRAKLGARDLVIDPRADEPAEGGDMVRLRPSVKGRPGLIGWAVDTARAVPWIGPRGIEWMEHEVFRIRDAAVRGYHRVAPEDTAEEIALDMGIGQAPLRVGLGEQRAEADPAQFAVLGWPPEPLVPMDLPRRYESEGRWTPLEPGSFVPGQPDSPPLFATTWLRADRERQYARVYVVAWDPRQVELKIRSGAAEPADETGATGTGQVPRDPRTIGRLVGAFNGGFQAIHGEYGLMEDGHAFLPPKPWAATVAELADGSVGFGTWPEDLPRIPEDVVAYRQNMTPLVADGRFNPYGRSWWGAAPPQAPDQVHTVRTGICMMQDGFVAYLWGNDLSHEALGNAMQLARCEYGIHLDMNMGLCGFELYRMLEATQDEEVGRPLEADFEAEGEVEGTSQRFRARRLVRSMNSMNFPRYVGREQRDFFYLLARPRLPGPALEPPIDPPEPGEGRFIIDGLPHNGFPWAFARTFVRPLATRPDATVVLARVDPDRVRTSPPVEPGVLLGAIVPGASGVSIEASGDAFTLGGPLLEAASEATAAVGIDRDGFLVFAQGPDREALAAAMSLARVSGPRALGSDARFTFHFGSGRVARLDEGPALADPDAAIRLWAVTDTETARRLFADVPFAPPRVWQAKQAERVRYHRGRR
ncbi:MAG: hypothetical protein HYY06_15195 [Deltaproteobacteria bacterium]|nr:hypothetical protein [Deltaproteobacteria bacterium]